MRRTLSAAWSTPLLCCCVVLAFLFPSIAFAQETGTVTGTVTRAGEGAALSSVSVTVQGTGQSTVTGADGKYTLRRVPAGPQTIVFRWLGYRPTQVQVTVEAGSTVTADAGMEQVTVALTEIVVEGASRAPERIVEAPSAISVVPQEVLQDASITGQAPMAFQTVPGVDLVQSGVNDFNVNARGFNSTLNRRMLVLQDGRDLAIAFLGSQEWNGMTQPLEDLGKVEVVRGPGSALYGANAFSGVINITTPTAREALGTKATVAGGELETFRGDLRHASVFANDRIGFRLNAGYNRSDTYSRSRTRADSTSLEREYADATDEPVGRVVEAAPLFGQSLDPATRDAIGDRDPLKNAYGSGRLDYYLDNGSVLSVDGGASQVENEIFVTGIGRVQVRKAVKPYARVAMAADRYNLFAFWNSRTSIDPQVSLTSGLNIEERSDIFHVEGQTNWNFLQDRGRIVTGASFRNTRVNTSGTLMNLANDDRSDNMESAYGQVEYKVHPMVRLVGAARVDDGDLFDTQFSPKGAIVFSPNENHSFRFSVNRAFQTPNYSEFFLQVPVRAPSVGPAGLQKAIQDYYATIQATPLAPTLQGLTTSLPWNFLAPDGVTPIPTQALAMGNGNLKVEKVTGWEFGYKGSLTEKMYVSVDGYINKLRDFVTDLLPGVNQVQFPSYTLDQEVNVPADLATLDARLAAQGLPPNHPLRAAIPQLLGGYAQVRAGTTVLGANALATLPDGNRAVVLSYTNAGRVTERGVEVGVGYQFTPEIRGDASFTGFDFTVNSQQLGDQLLPNTPSKKATFSLSYAGIQGIDANVTVRLVDGYEWATGVFQGYVPSSEFVNVSAGYRVNNYIRVHGTATNLFDQKRFQMFGGSVIGRRVLGGVTATF